MALSYDQRKKSYEWLNDTQKQQYNDLLKNKGDDYRINQYMKQYQQASQPQQQVQQQPIQQEQKGSQDSQQQPLGEVKTVTPKEQQESIKQAQERIKAQNQGLDTSKFWETNGQVSVKEWTAAQTGKPDYQNDSEARMQEITNNLNAYRQNNPEFFKDRNTFNTMFHYNDRDESQKALLDTYWKKKEDINKVSTYTSWESVNNSMKNWEITTDQLNLLKEYNPEAYQKWQQLQEDEVMKRIVNDIVPKAVEEISWKINSMIEALGIQAQDALDIEWIYNDTMAKVWAWQTLEDCNNTVKQIEAITNKKTAIMNRYANSTWWTVSDALAAARMAKAIAPYNEQLQGLQYQYQDYSNLYSQKTATAYQAANVRAMQAQENQRIRQQKCSALGFATSALSYRTPEEQAQLQLQTQQAQNEMQLLQQSRLNDLNRYNTYATTKMQNQLQAELTDLSVEDEQQLKANLNNVLSDYYKNYWDIIQRSQAQVVDDVIAYAKKNWISVAQALSENFIKPLQNKAEYKQKIASDYGMLSKQTITTINWKSVIMTTNPNWSISYQYIEDPDSVTSTAKPYDLVDEKVFDVSPQSHNYYTLGDFINDPDNAENTHGWQCWKFVNDYLEKIGVGRYYDNALSTKLNSINTDTAKVWSIAVFDYWHKSSDWINHGHVGIVVEVDKDWKGFRVLDSNWDLDKPETIEKRHILYWSPSCKGFFDPSKPASATTSGESEWYVSWRIWLYDKYINQWTKPTDAMLKSWGDGDISKWLDKFEAEVEAYKQAQWYTDTYSPEAVSEITALRKEFNNLDTVETYRSMQDYYDKLLKANNWTAAWDMAMVFNFMKMLDPNSVVREWEYASAAATRWLGSTLIQYFKKVDSWEILTKSQREDFINIAKDYLQWAADRYNRDLKQYRTYITKWWNPDWIWLYAELDTTTWATTDKEKYFGWLYTVNTWAWTVADFDNASFILG